jgi:hypothetical protein
LPVLPTHEEALTIPQCEDYDLRDFGIVEGAPNP